MGTIDTSPRREEGSPAPLPHKFLAAMALVMAFVGIEASWSPGAIDISKTAPTCDKVASPFGSNSYAGTAAKPYATVDRLARSLTRGQTGCLRGGVYHRDVEIMKGGTFSAPITITSFPGERATVLGRLHIADTANNVVVQQLNLDGRNGENLPSPTVNGDNAAFRDNDVTNRQTSICFLLGSREYGRAKGTVIERNRIHNCGLLPPTNHHHGIYVEASDNARIIDNWIYDNADRGIQMFPDAQRSYIARNVLDGNGQNVVYSRSSANNVVENNVISNSVVRYNVEDVDLVGPGNVLRRNCLWSTRHPGNLAGILPGIHVAVVENLVTDPLYANRAAKDYRLVPGSPCLNLSTAPPPQPPKAAKNRKRPLRLRAAAGTVRPGGRVRLLAQLWPDNVGGTPKRARLKISRGGRWLRVATMRLRDSTYSASVSLRKFERRDYRRFGSARLPRGARTLRLRAFVDAGPSNIVLVLVRR
jgi:hypothetical protein